MSPRNLNMEDVPRFCANCGKELIIGANFCTYCSNPVQIVGQNQPAAPPLFAPQKQLRSDAFSRSRRISFLLGIGIFFIPYIFAWFTLRRGYSTQARAIALGWAGFVILFSFINISTSPARRSTSSTSANANSVANSVNAAQVEMQKAANAVASSANSGSVSVNKMSNASQGSCADIESQLTSVESEQAQVERMLDATADFGPQAGSPKRAIYMNALKRKGELKARYTALEEKLRSCGKSK